MSLKSGLIEALNDVASHRSCVKRRKQALDTLERLLAEACACNAETGQLELFLTLQECFECNIACRLIHCVSAWIPVLQQAFNSASTESSDLDVSSTPQIIIQSLSILQGIALLHAPSKEFLGKKWCIQIFIDLLALSRHLSPMPLSSSINANTLPSASTASPTHTLASSSIDALLCVLVDSPSALRAFEDADGVEAVVKTLKRTGVARDIRIKSLEFLYFYLLDETAEMTLSPGVKQKTNLPLRDTVPLPSPPAPSSRSPSTSPRKNLRMLRKDVDFVPITPKKGHAPRPRLGIGTPRTRTPQSVSVPSPTKKGRTSPVDVLVTSPSLNTMRIGSEQSLGELNAEATRVQRKTTQEKKELLGNLLGNVESLVESVSTSGIWGLG